LDLSDEGRSGSGWPLKWPAVALLALALVAAIFASRKFGKKSKHLKRRGEELNECQDE
jgi:membrane protein implicated in regulation of membrane protease activity